jgi:4-hydroxybenzoate polyprenyltransferase
MIREYLKLSRSFNAVLTGISPVMGAISMGEYSILTLLILFIIGFLGHTFGFVFNDIIDYKIDKTSKEISDRPLISGTIKLKNAWIFAFSTLIIAFIIASILAYYSMNYYPLIILTISAFFIISYDLISKKLPFMDFFVSLGIFFFILYGASTVVDNIYQISLIAWIVCLLGSIQVFFMQIVAGGMKDIENDYKKGAKTAAIKLGVRVENNKLLMSRSFKFFTYLIQLVNIIIITLPFFILPAFINQSLFIKYFQWIIISLIAIMMFILSHRLLSLKIFNRKKVRRYIGSHYMINFALVPILLITLNPWSGILVFFPALGFILSNIILHGTILQPKTM